MTSLSHAMEVVLAWNGFTEHFKLAKRAVLFTELEVRWPPHYHKCCVPWFVTFGPVSIAKRRMKTYMHRQQKLHLHAHLPRWPIIKAAIPDKPTWYVAGFWVAPPASPSRFASVTHFPDSNSGQTSLESVSGFKFWHKFLKSEICQAVSQIPKFRNSSILTSTK